MYDIYYICVYIIYIFQSYTLAKLMYVVHI